MRGPDRWKETSQWLQRVPEQNRLLWPARSQLGRNRAPDRKVSMRGMNIFTLGFYLTNFWKLQRPQFDIRTHSYLHWSVIRPSYEEHFVVWNPSALESEPIFRAQFRRYQTPCSYGLQTSWFLRGSLDKEWCIRNIVVLQHWKNRRFIKTTAQNDERTSTFLWTLVIIVWTDAETLC